MSLYFSVVILSVPGVMESEGTDDIRSFFLPIKVVCLLIKVQNL